MTINHKELLIKYIHHVIEQEGISFIDFINDAANEIKFTDEEVKELQTLDKTYEDLKR